MRHRAAETASLQDVAGRATGAYLTTAMIVGAVGAARDRVGLRGLASVCLTHDLRGKVRGLHGMPRDLWPTSLPLMFWSFRITVSLGLLVIALVALLAWRYFVALDRRAEVTPLLRALGLFPMSYVGLGISQWPMIDPRAISIRGTATHPSSRAFLLAGAVVLMSTILACTGHVDRLFRGKGAAGAPGYHGGRAPHHGPARAPLTKRATSSATENRRLNGKLIA